MLSHSRNSMLSHTDSLTEVALHVDNAAAQPMHEAPDMPLPISLRVGGIGLGVLAAGAPETVVELLLGPEGAASATLPEWSAALAALHMTTADAAEALVPPLLARLASTLDRGDHDVRQQ